MKGKGFIATPLLALIVLFTAGVAVFTYFQFKPSTVPTKQTNLQPISSPVISPLANETAKLETYSDEKKNFSFKYPKGWDLSANVDTVILKDDVRNITIQTSTYPSITFETMFEKPDGEVKQNPVYIWTKIKNLDLSGYRSSIRIAESTPGNQQKGYTISVYIERGAPITLIQMSSSDLDTKDESLILLDNLLKSVVFTN